MNHPLAVVFTDLDGTLLDHATYQAGPAGAALKDLVADGVRVYLCSAKTLAEQRAIVEELGVEVGMIVENGAAVFGPEGHPHVFGRSYEEVRAGLRDAAAEARAQVRGYGDMAIDEIVERTGLDSARASFARDRMYTESFVLEAGSADELRRAMAHRGFRLARGSRFLTAQGDHDKGMAVRYVTADLGGEVTSYGLGDYDNDLEMLDAVDVPMQVQLPDRSWREIPVGGIRRLGGVGPEGWCIGAGIVRKRHLSS